MKTTSTLIAVSFLAGCVASQAVSVRPAQAQAKPSGLPRYEVKCLNPVEGFAGSAQDISKRMSAEGAEGWRLVTVTQTSQYFSHLYCFERPLP